MGGRGGPWGKGVTLGGRGNLGKRGNLRKRGNRHPDGLDNFQDHTSKPPNLWIILRNTQGPPLRSPFLKQIKKQRDPLEK